MIPPLSYCAISGLRGSYKATRNAEMYHARVMKHLLGEVATRLPKAGEVGLFLNGWINAAIRDAVRAARINNWCMIEQVKALRLLAKLEGK